MFLNTFTSHYYSANEIIPSIFELVLPKAVLIPAIAEILENPEFKSQADVDSQNSQGLSPLHIAIMRSDHQLVDFLLNKSIIPALPEPYDFKGANTENQTHDGYYPIHLAAKYSDAAMIRKLLYHGAELDCRNNQNMTPLMVAVSNLNTATVKQLLRLRADSNAISDYRARPLHFLARFGLDPKKSEKVKEISQLLIDFGADTESRDITGKTPVLVAASAGNISLVEALSTEPSTRPFTDRVMDLIGIHQFKSANLYATIQKTRPDSINVDGDTVFHAAVKNYQIEMIGKLLDLVPELINTPNGEGFTPLDIVFTEWFTINYGEEASELLRQILCDKGARLARMADNIPSREEAPIQFFYQYNHRSRASCINATQLAAHSNTI